MRCVVQRVNKAMVSVDDKCIAEICKGIVVFVGIGKDDDESDVDYLAAKIPQLRIFEDAQGRANLSLIEIKGEILVVSQFTLYGDCRRGRRPSFSEAAEPGKAHLLYRRLINKIQQQGVTVSTGEFQAHMAVELVNDGPVTILLDSKKTF